MTDALSHVTVGVARMADALALWVDRFGLEVAAAREGPDPALAGLWGLAPERIAAQRLLRTPGARTGALHLVAFQDPGPPVRAGAAATDLCPKSIDVNCTDIGARVAELRAAGCTFRTPVSEYEVDGLRAREAQMTGPDDTNIVLIEILGDDLPLGPRGYGAVTSFVVTVPDTAVEAAFYRDVLGLDEVMHHRIAGPGIEQAVGLPPGAALDLRLMGRDGDSGHKYGRMELIAYEGARGANRHPLARPPATGILGCGYAVADLDVVAARAASRGYRMERHSGGDMLPGTGPVLVLRSPAGLRVEVRAGR